LNKLLVIIAGPTASGKTRLAIELALHFKTEIVSADSRQFYRELNIGTAKPSKEELLLVIHHFINSHSVSQQVSAGTYADKANRLLEDLFKKHDVVIMAGGSGLYIDAVISGIDDLPGADAVVRKDLENLFHSGGVVALQQKLMELDPEGYSIIDVSNPRRLIRALEISITSGLPYSTLLGRKKSTPGYNWLMAGIEWPRKILYERINARTEQMIRNGLKEEAEQVIAYRHTNALSTVGYKEMFEHIDGVRNLEETTSLIAQHTRNYAKRQLTWFRRYGNMIWIKPGEEKELAALIENKISES
jgi:tRNA dimethylallyltransferase